MTPEIKKRALALTQEIVSDFWNGKTDLFFHLMDEAILWIGALEEEYLHGAQRVKDHVSDILTAFPQVHLLNEVYAFGPVGRDDCTIIGHYTGYTDLSSGQLFSETQRITYLWHHQVKAQGADDLRLVHVHISNFWHPEGDALPVPIKAGAQTYHYLQVILHQRQGDFFREAYFFKSTRKSYHHLHSDDILYLEARQKNTVIHCLGQEVEVAMGIAKLSAILSPTFVPIHRSYVINPFHLLKMERSRVTLSDNTVLEVPVKEYAPLKKRLSLALNCDELN